jgi:hypothetical protein
MWNIVDRIIFISGVCALRIKQGNKLSSCLRYGANENNDYNNKRQLSLQTDYAASVANHRNCGHHKVKTIKEVKPHNKVIFSNNIGRIDNVTVILALGVIKFVFDKLN